MKNIYIKLSIICLALAISACGHSHYVPTESEETESSGQEDVGPNPDELVESDRSFSIEEITTGGGDLFAGQTLVVEAKVTYSGFEDDTVVILNLAIDGNEVESVNFVTNSGENSDSVAFSALTLPNKDSIRAKVSWMEDPEVTALKQFLIRSPGYKKMIFDGSDHDLSRWRTSSDADPAELRYDVWTQQDVAYLPLTGDNPVFVFDIDESVEDYQEITWSFRLTSDQWVFDVVLEDASGDFRMLRYHGYDFGTQVDGKHALFGYGDGVGVGHWKQFVRNFEMDAASVFPEFAPVRLKEFHVVSNSPVSVDDISLRHPRELLASHNALGLNFEYAVTSEVLDGFLDGIEDEVEELKACLNADDLNQDGFTVSFQPPYNWRTPYFRDMLNCRLLGANIDYCYGRVDHNEQIIWLAPSGSAFKHELIHIYLRHRHNNSDSNHDLFPAAWACQQL